MMKKNLLKKKNRLHSYAAGRVVPVLILKPFVIYCFLAVISLITVLPVNVFSAESSSDLYTIAKGAFQDGLYDLAKRNFKKIVKDHPDSDDADSAQYYIGLCYYLKNNFNAAVYELNKLLKNYPDSTLHPRTEYFIADSYLKMGVSFLQKGGAYKKRGKSRVMRSLSLLRKLIQKYPKDPFVVYARFSLGFAYMRLDRFPRAQKEFLWIIKNKPGHTYAPNARYQVGQCFFKQDDYRAAIKHFNLLLIAYKTSNLVDDAIYWLGESYYWLKKFSKAREKFENILRNFPKSKYAVDARYRIAFSYFKEKKRFKAAGLFKDFLRKHPRSSLAADVLHNIGIIYKQKKEYLKAAGYFKKIYTKFPASKLAPEARINVAVSYYKLKKYKDALRIFKSVRGRLSRDYRVFVLKRIGDIYFVQGRLALAKAAYKKCIKTYPAHKISEDVYYWLGVAQFKDKKYNDAHRTFVKMRRFFPQTKRLAEIIFRIAESA
ncbi:MAG: tetratricopeptide repeat protein, partial [Spirochaetes bacterium]|nr:tetratricopeptide repeat protein [Spirochaetota bacterium]